MNRKIKKKIVLNMNCVFRHSLRILSEIFLILGRNERDVIKSVYCYSRIVLAILARF